MENLDSNFVKKVLYRENPQAVLVKKENGKTYYEATTSGAGVVEFAIPDEEMIGESGLPIVGETESAKLLIRWMVSK